MARLPANLVEADPRLAAAFAGSRLEDGDLDTADRFLAVARRTRSAIAGDAEQSFAVTLAVVELERARLGGSVQEAQRLVAELCEPARGSNGARRPAEVPRSMALATLGATELWNGDPRMAGADLEQALALGTERRQDRVRVNCLAHLAILDLLEGRLTRAQEKGADAIELCERYAWSEGPATACARLAWAMISYHQGEREQAQRMIKLADGATTEAEGALRQAIGVMRARIMVTGGEAPARMPRSSSVRSGPR